MSNQKFANHYLSIYQYSSVSAKNLKLAALLQLSLTEPYCSIYLVFAKMETRSPYLRQPPACLHNSSGVGLV
ncbi:MAG: hypothetical protein RMX65_012460 [Nostoc sp. DedQUE01]|nr:hypothetical protein [Nostoc sp. DedQUE11]MDZ8071781.1 hypothetical protein [Nostoc sp. DedQUE01]